MSDQKRNIVLVNGAIDTTPLYGGTFGATNESIGEFTLDVSVLGAGTQLDLDIADSHDGTTFQVRESFSTVIAAPAHETIRCENFARFIRAQWTFTGGTTEATVKVTAAVM